MLLFKRIKYRKAVKEYSSIVTLITKLLYDITIKISDIDDFIARPKNRDSGIIIDLIMLDKLISRYESNPLHDKEILKSLEPLKDENNQFSEMMSYKDKKELYEKKLIDKLSSPEIDKGTVDMRIRIGIITQLIFHIRLRLMRDLLRAERMIVDEYTICNCGKDIISYKFNPNKAYTNIRIRISSDKEIGKHVNSEKDKISKTS